MLCPSIIHDPMTVMDRLLYAALALSTFILTCSIQRLPPAYPAPAIARSDVRDLRAGERYGGGTRIRSPFVGISFVVPKDWRASLPSGSVVFLDSALIAGLGTVHLLTDVSKDTILAQLAEPQSIEPGFLLHPVGSVQDDGTTLRGTYAGGEDVGVIAARTGPFRNAVVYQFIGRKTEIDVYRRLVDEMADSTLLATEQESLALRSWYERLTGMMLGSQSEKDAERSPDLPVLHLCSDGRFIRSIRLQPVPGRPMEGEDSGMYHETGSWLIKVDDGNGSLILSKSTGEMDRQTLRQQGDQLLLDGQATTTIVSNRCL